MPRHKDVKRSQPGQLSVEEKLLRAERRRAAAAEMSAEEMRLLNATNMVEHLLRDTKSKRAKLEEK
jgi:hypothetical protein